MRATDLDRLSDEMSDDGRVARRQRNRERVLDAYVELMRRGVVDPSAIELADFAEVTSRTVYRYLSEDADFMSDLAARLVAVMRPIATFVASGETSLDDRVAEYVEFRLGLHFRTAQTVREVRLHRAHASTVVAVTDEMRAIMRAQLASLFAPELSRHAPERARLDVAGLQALLLFDSLEYLSEQSRGDRRAMHEALCRQFRAVLTATTATTATTTVGTAPIA